MRWTHFRLVGKPGGAAEPARRSAAEIVIDDQRGAVASDDWTRARRRRLAAELSVAAGVHEACVVDGIVGDDASWTAGASRNAALLLGLGGRVSMTDADVEDDAYLLGESAPLSCSAADDPMRLTFFESDEAALGEIPDGPKRPRTEALAELFGEIPAAEGMPGVKADTPLTVRVAMLGMAGDAGMGAAMSRLFFRGAALARLVGEEGSENYRALRLSRSVRRYAAAPLAGRGSYLMTPCAGFDTTRMLPPFPSTGRNEEGNFAWVLRAIDPTAAIGYSPEVILHKPERRTFVERDLFRVAVEPSIDTLFAIVVTSQCAELQKGFRDGDSAEERLRRLGAELLSLGELPAMALGGIVRHHVLTHARGARGFLKGALEQSCPEGLSESGYQALQGDRRELAARLDAAIEDERYPFYEEPRSEDRLPGSEAVSTLAQRLLRYGALCKAWPALWKAAHQRSA